MTETRTPVPIVTGPGTTTMTAKPPDVTVKCRRCHCSILTLHGGAAMKTTVMICPVCGKPRLWQPTNA